MDHQVQELFDFGLKTKGFFLAHGNTKESGSRCTPKWGGFSRFQSPAPPECTIPQNNS
ncbi:hypothetical protein LHGZ1_0475 [Laribacter hongkongensis]|uniref:Uncharacterized protein n=1 Tax=Laribacter hongkongensis TaxID=168471 RepID=A0A248LFY6_9NEIS|nr:hypothetical protein LHGZ1_0475 [Laribacter hongkongensis]